jgi:3-dehydroquinate synthase
MYSLPELLHGEAVALDVLFSCHIAKRRGLLKESELERVVSIMRSMELPLRHHLFEDPTMLQAALADTMKHRDGLQRLPMPNGIGQCVFLNDVSKEEIRLAALEMADADN